MEKKNQTNWDQCPPRHGRSLEKNIGEIPLVAQKARAQGLSQSGVLVHAKESALQRELGRCQRQFNFDPFY